VLVARIRAILRRTSAPPQEEEATLSFGKLEILPGRHEVKVSGKPVQLTLTEFRILHFLARRPGWVFTRYQIIDAVQGEDHIVTDRSVDVQVVGLRKKLGPVGKYIETVRGVGYRFRK
jgi:two-component system phosphate regulon response regulator PhoB